MEEVDDGIIKKEFEDGNILVYKNDNAAGDGADINTEDNVGYCDIAAEISLRVLHHLN